MGEEEIRFNTIYVIQSLNSEHERATGTNLYNDVLKIKSWQYANIRSALKNVTSKQDLFDCLRDIEIRIESEGDYPYLHFEMHGSDDKKGLILINNELITWEELYDHLQRLNIKAKNNVFISMATCFGGYLIRIFNKMNQPCPFYGFIGPIYKVGERNIEDSYVEYFTVLLDTKDFNVAVDALRRSNEGRPYDFVFLTCHAYFKLIVAEMKNKPTGRINQILYETARKDPRHRKLSNNKLRKMVDRFQILNEDEVIADMRRTFTMSDQ